ncbi:LacI family DNA-binding transcriptional regulator [Coraliomargarita sp. SDUM461004]|uniref:LacI family DNA-binding transcriptional regulator n=1 Tax=Thalassobacterium sedimentorum TaxID=3041258 RepID=A0ABU1AE02_9BACT|nr:LacI family DNA-binding transcriptional regulator [Coraliomargarita sp. SDUM461004]MDQ8192980.1 LacI family DNA-binding transcriptional regulator [Coraliomargarita sp. SDUM461004]
MASYITIKDIAREAGMHYSTVSLALREDPRLSEATRSRIRKIANEMGYVPSAAMKALCAYREQNRTRPIQSALAYLTDMPRSDPFNAMVMRRARMKAQQLGYELNEYNLSDAGSSLKHFKSVWWNRGIKGVLVGPFAESGADLGDEWSQFIVIEYGYSVSQPNFTRAVLDHYHNMLTHLDILRKRGYRRIGLVLSQALSNRTHGILHSAYLYEQVASGSAKIELHSKDFLDATSIRQWIDRNQLDAVIAHEREHALILESGLKIPEEVGFSIIGWKGYSPKTPDEISGFDTKPEILAESAVSFLVAQMHEHVYGVPKTPKSLMVAGEYHEGGTILPAVAAS